MYGLLADVKQTLDTLQPGKSTKVLGNNKYYVYAKREIFLKDSFILVFYKKTPHHPGGTNTVTKSIAEFSGAIGNKPPTTAVNWSDALPLPKSSEVLTNDELNSFSKCFMQIPLVHFLDFVKETTTVTNTVTNIQGKLKLGTKFCDIWASKLKEYQLKFNSILETKYFTSDYKSILYEYIYPLIVGNDLNVVTNDELAKCVCDGTFAVVCYQYLAKITGIEALKIRRFIEEQSD